MSYELYNLRRSLFHVNFSITFNLERLFFLIAIIISTGLYGFMFFTEPNLAAVNRYLLNKISETLKFDIALQYYKIIHLAHLSKISISK